MLRVGICDDEPLVAGVLKRNILEIADRNGWNINVSYYESGNELLEAVDVLQAVFLDIDMPQMDGIETGKRIGEKNPECKIIMATGRADRFKDAFKIKAYDFVTKPFDKEEIKMVLDRYIKESKNLKKMDVYKNRNKYSIFYKDIRYIKAADSDVEIYVENEIFRKEISLNVLEVELDSNLFFRINRQYIVNMRWITDYEKGNISIGNMNMKVSIRKRKIFERKFVEYDVSYK